MSNSPQPNPQTSPPPGSNMPPREPWGWTRPQRIGLGMLLGILVAVLVIDYLRRPYRLGDQPAIVEGTPITLPQQMDPNTANKEELARIPHIGEALAGRIIEYREARKTTAAEGIVFHRLEDLDAVPGIGKKLIEQLSTYLQFPDETTAHDAR